MLHGRGLEQNQKYLTDNPETECAWYPKSGKLVVINNSKSPQSTKIKTDFGISEVRLQPFDTMVIELNK